LLFLDDDLDGQAIEGARNCAFAVINFTVDADGLTSITARVARECSIGVLLGHLRALVAWLATHR
jgi:hypothetical protein